VAAHAKVARVSRAAHFAAAAAGLPGLPQQSDTFSQGYRCPDVSNQTGDPVFDDA